VLTTTTTQLAHVQDQHGRRLTGYRIGPTTHTMAKTTGILLGRPGLQRFKLA